MLPQPEIKTTILRQIRWKEVKGKHLQNQIPTCSTYESEGAPLSLLIASTRNAVDHHQLRDTCNKAAPDPLEKIKYTIKKDTRSKIQLVTDSQLLTRDVKKHPFALGFYFDPPKPFLPPTSRF